MISHRITALRRREFLLGLIGVGIVAHDGSRAAAPAGMR
jgi:hypothetical protein